jgi:arginase family enzyme
VQGHLFVSEDSLWPRASHWLQPATSERTQLGIFGVPAFQTSISSTGAHQTPAAIREALSRFSTFSYTANADLRDISFADFGDVRQPDSAEGEERTMGLAHSVSSASDLSIALGGDNSITYAVMRGVFGDGLSEAGLITLDAHHDVRDGVSNGSPVRRLIEAGLPGTSIVQIGINDFSNSPEYAKRARDCGIHVITRQALRTRTIESIIDEAISVVGDRKLHVDIDMDVCDQSVAPACPAATPGGISADELRQFAFAFGKISTVVSCDITEIDAHADGPDLRTVRLGALAVLEIASGYQSR